MEARRFRRSNVPLRVLLLGALVLMLAGCTVLPTMGQEEPTPTPVPAPPIPDKPTYVVQRGVVEQTLKFSGRVGPALEHELFFRQDGRIARVYVQNDDEVVQGQLLAELDNTDLYQQIEQVELDLSAARSALAAAQADIDYARQRAAIALDIQRLNLQKLEAHSDTADLTIARANLQSAEAERKAAQRAYDDRAAQPGAEASGQALALERATINYTIVKANYDKVLAARAQREIDLEIERQRLALSELEYGHLATEVDPSLAKAITRSKLSLARLQGQYNTTIITA
ncbi:MAG: biotin/lipoyl-binding protein, partial [Chloroflexi bacterium]|nr:biotin/lipoyl-binding protein [Chloroflexota bacterium]